MPSTEAETCVVNPTGIDEAHVHVAAAIVWETPARQRFLIARRPEGKHLELHWELPGGKVEPGESVREALQRELAEEINIRPVSASPFMRVYYRYPERNILLDAWTVETYRGKVVAAEAQPLAWIEIGQIQAFKFPPADEPILQALGRR